jgi:hypothetical protein
MICEATRYVYTNPPTPTSTRLDHELILPVNANNPPTLTPLRCPRQFGRIFRFGIRTLVPIIPHLSNPIQIRAEPRIENKRLHLEISPVRYNPHDPRLVGPDVVLHDGPCAAPNCKSAGSFRRRCPGLRTSWARGRTSSELASAIRFGPAVGARSPWERPCPSRRYPQRRPLQGVGSVGRVGATGRASRGVAGV